MALVTLASPLLADRTGAGITVAVVDSGVHPSHPHVGSVGATTWIPGAATDAVDRLGHGTAVAAAIRDIAPGAELIVAKVFDRALTTSGDVLARAMDWCLDHGARVINLSLGTTNRAHTGLLTASIDRCAASGTLVVAARDMDGASWLPGVLPGVIAVVAEGALAREEIRVAADGPAGATIIRAAPWPRSIPGVPRERNLSGVSFAVANVSGFVARLLEARPALRGAAEVIQALSTS